MAQIVLGLGGAVAGGYFGGSSGAAVGQAAGSAAGSYIDSLWMGHPSSKGPKLEDTRVSAATYAKFRPIVFGVVRLATEMIWSSGIQVNIQHAVTKEGAQTNILYYGSYAVEICQNQGSILRIFADKHCLKDYRPAHGAFNSQSATFAIYPGTQTQGVNGQMQTSKGAAFTPRYPGAMVLVIEHISLTAFGGHFPQVEVELTTNSTPAYPVVDVTVPGSPMADNMMIDPVNAVLLQPGTGGMTKIDTWSGTVISITSTETPPSLGNYCLGSIDDSVFRPSGIAEDFMPVVRLDGNSFIETNYWGQTVIGPDTGAMSNVPEPGFMRCAQGYLMVVGNPGGVSANGTVYVIAESLYYQNGTPINAGFSGLPASPYGFLRPVIQLRQVTGANGGLSMCDMDTPTSAADSLQSIISANIWAVGTPGAFSASGADVSVAAGTGVYTSAALIDFLTAGFKIGNKVVITGGTGGNNGTFQVTGVTSSTLTTSNSGSTTELAGATIAFSCGGRPTLYQLAFVDGSAAAPPPGTFGLSFFGDLIGVIVDLIYIAITVQNSLTLINTYDLSGVLPGDIGTQMGVAYIAATNQLLIGGETQLIKWDIASATTIAGPTTGAGGGIGTLGTQTGWLNFATSNSQFVCPIGGNQFSLFDVLAWESNGVWNATAWGVTLSSNVCYDSNSNAVWGAQGGGVVEMFLNRVASGGVTLDTVVAYILQLAGLQSAQFDVTRLSSYTVDGYIIARSGTILSYLQPLMAAFFFDIIENNYKLVCVPRGDSPAITLTKDDLGAYIKDTKRPDPLNPVRPQIQELPVQVEVAYQSKDLAYQRGYQMARRNGTNLPVTVTKHETSEVPVIMSGDDAVTIATKMLCSAWVNRTTFDFKLGRNWLQLNPTNVIQVDKDGLIYIMRIQQIDFDPSGILAVKAVQEDPGIWNLAAEVIGGSSDSVIDGAGSSGASATLSLVISATLLDLFDSPAMNDGDALNAGFYAAAGPIAALLAWTGASVTQSTNGGSSYSPFDSISVESCLGYATTALAEPPRGNVDPWDNISTVTIWSISNNALLNSQTPINVLNGGNLAFLGTPTGGELIAFTTVIANVDGSYTLSGLLRGLRGSDPWAYTHLVGDTFVLIGSASGATHSEELDPSQIGLLYRYEAISIGAPSAGTPISFATQGNRLKPLTVCSVAASRDGSSNLFVTWLRRTRIGGDNDWLDGVLDVPLGETTESYSVDIYNISTGLVVRTLTSVLDTTGIEYTAAEQVTDFGSTQSSVEMIIYQISSVVGRGFGLEVTV